MDTQNKISQSEKQTSGGLFDAISARYAITKHHIQFILLSFNAWSDFIFDIPKNILFQGAISQSLSNVRQRIEIGRSFRDYLIDRSVEGA